MTAKEEQKKSTKWKVPRSSDGAQQTTKNENEKSSNEQTTNTDDLQTTIAQLEKEVAEQKEITKRAQYDYINLKADFDRRQRVKNEETKTAYIDTLIASVQKFLPFVESLRKSIETIPADQQENALAKGVQMTYNKFIQTLEGMHIKPIEALWLEPDWLLHEPVSAQPVDDKKMKGKIVTEFERWFVYDDGETKKVVNTSKVVVGQ